jgi:hypothetical protein
MRRTEPELLQARLASQKLRIGDLDPIGGRDKWPFVVKKYD